MPLSYIRRRFGATSVSYAECRDCGKTVKEDFVECSLYGSENISRYEWS
jgi:RNA polymerase subunit RPABC4/transcription elongation factor Spt4